MPTTVRVSHVTRRYGSVAVLDDVSFDLSPGITALLGPNGAGKTTLLGLLSTASRADAGEITVLGRRADGPLAERTEIRRRLGFLPQEVRFPAGMTAFGFLDYIAVLKEWDDTAARHGEVRRVLGVVGLDDRPTIKVRKLSGGQRRRLAFAQATTPAAPTGRANRGKLRPTGGACCAVGTGQHPGVPKQIEVCRYGATGTTVDD